MGKKNTREKAEASPPEYLYELTTLQGMTASYPVETARALASAFDVAVCLQITAAEAIGVIVLAGETPLKGHDLEEMRTWLRGYDSGLAQEV